VPAAVPAQAQPGQQGVCRLHHIHCTGGALNCSVADQLQQQGSL
jgi:hypothetical protein